ncbi:RBBP9/YdeN family alpha/beta hydrolase [Leifsonia sp. 2TAF2]|uniref:RBBP9/YdeN family alpha/beta hydrolase n=1 Tax=Leifsonia sp. 2TAF2 TaxID=3233009 RepID=UPI003F9A4A62
MKTPLRTITVPGIGGSDERHWQTIWERESTDMLRFAPQSWDEPDFDEWSGALDRAVGTDPVVVVAHSLGCLLAVRWAHANPDRVAGLFLVAAPDPDGPNFPRQGTSFARELQVRPPSPGVIIASEDDPYCTPERSAALAASWGLPRISVGEHGHLNSASGLGSWSEGRNLLTAFVAGLRRAH